MRLLPVILFITIGSALNCSAQDAPKSVKTLRVQQSSPESTSLYSLGPDGVVRIDWHAVETLAASKSDRTLSPIAEVMIAIRDKTWKPMR